MRPQPVLFLIEHLTDGGTESHLHDLVVHLNRDRFAPHVMCFQQGLMADRIAAHDDIPVSQISVKRAYDHTGLRAIWKIRRYCQKNSIKALVTYHFMADCVGTAAAWGLSPLAVISSRRDVGFTRNQRQLRIGTFLDRRVDHYIAVSEAVRQAVVDDENVDPDKFAIIYNGCNIQELDQHPWDRMAERQKLGIDSDETVLTCVANFNPIKGHRYLIEAFAKLAARQSDRRLRLVLAGDGPERGAIESGIRQLHLEDRVLLQGYSQDVRREFVISDIVVLASETEGFSNTIAQGMAFRKPVVATRVGGNVEAILHNETGLLVPPRDPQSLADALGRVVQDPNLGRCMGECGRRRAEQEFSIETMLARSEDLLSRFIGRVAAQS